MDKVTTRILELQEGKITEYQGNYTYYKEKKKDLEAFEKDRNGETISVISKEIKEVKEKPKNKYKTETTRADVEKAEKVEMEIARLEATMKMYTLQMNEEPERYEELMEIYKETEEKLQTLYERWDKIMENM